jgi:hypothetical protein
MQIYKSYPDVDIIILDCTHGLGARFAIFETNGTGYASNLYGECPVPASP